jgi:hypothetical protein
MHHVSVALAHQDLRSVEMLKTSQASRDRTSVSKVLLKATRPHPMRLNSQHEKDQYTVRSAEAVVIVLAQEGKISLRPPDVRLPLALGIEPT